MVFCIRRTGSTVQYLIDGSVIYTSPTSNSNHLFYDNSHYDSPNSPVWGARPASAHYFDVAICPNGAYSFQDSENETFSTAALSGDSDRIEALENQVNELLSFIKDEASIDISGMDVEQSHITLTKDGQPALNQNRPNPFSTSTLIRYFVPEEIERAQVVFYDLNGRVLLSHELDRVGFGEISVNAEDLPNGLYSYGLILDGEIVDMKKMNVVK